jgi:hypothetical protein
MSAGLQPSGFKHADCPHSVDKAAISLWIKTAKEDRVEIPQPRGRLVYAWARFRILHFVFWLPAASLGQAARTISNPESGCSSNSARTHAIKSADLNICGDWGLPHPLERGHSCPPLRFGQHQSRHQTYRRTQADKNVRAPERCEMRTKAIRDHQWP